MPSHTAGCAACLGWGTLLVVIKIAHRSNLMRKETAMAVDTLQIVREIYGPSYMLHYGIYERSVAHRKQHGESQCDVYPSTAIHSLWPLLAAIVGAERFLEVGCGLGYTAALMAEAGGKSARVDTIEKSAIHAALAAEEISNAGLEDRVRILRGQATEVLEDLSGPYDVIFVDADWQDYPKWLPHFARLTRKGGILVSDNLFPLFEDWAQYLPHKESIREYLKALVDDGRFETHIARHKWQAFSYRL